jgi:hypothetical protein
MPAETHSQRLGRIGEQIQNFSVPERDIIWLYFQAVRWERGLNGMCRAFRWLSWGVAVLVVMLWWRW